LRSSSNSDLGTPKNATGRAGNSCFIVVDGSPGERRTLIVAIVTAVMMVVEIAVGMMSGSMALLADGLHMGSHTLALGVSCFAYAYARRNARNPMFTFGTGKVNALGGYSGAILLMLFAAWMSWESAERVLHPVAIEYSEAIVVAAIGLGVNAVSAIVLGHTHADGGHCHAHDHNLQAAYLHVLADAATSVVAILALVSARSFHTPWLDPLMGFAGSVLIISWSFGLIRRSSSVLLDHDGPGEIRDSLEASLEDLNAQVIDWHCWALAPGRFAAILSIVSDQPQTAEFYKSRLPRLERLVHLTLEVNAAPAER
jgi:cation diffusion facilitator family transporter